MPEDLEKGLNRIAARRAMLWIVFLSGIPVILAVGFISGSEKLTSITGYSWLGFFAISILLVTFSRCPNCDKFFHFSALIASPITEMCVHCGLKLD
jgi:hypothetical protein